MIVLFISHMQLLREAVLAVLNAADGIEAIGASSRDMAEAAARDLAPNVVLIDVSHPQGATLVAAVQAHVATAHVVVLATRERDEDALAWAEIGACGYSGPDTSSDDLIATMRRVAAGEVVYPPRVTALLLRQLVDRDTNRSARAGVHLLTLREREIAALLAQGLSNKVIARQLCIAVATTKNHIHSILDKWDVRSRGEAAARYRQQVQGEGEMCLPQPGQAPPAPTIRPWSDARAIQF